MIIGVVLKQPIEVVDYDIDCATLFNDDDTDDVDSVTIDVTPAGGVTIIPAIAPDKQSVKLWISAGDNFTEYKAEVNVTSVAGRVKQDEITIIVEDF
jgi:hypothetical protein